MNIIPSNILLRAYREGTFPMALENGSIAWFNPQRRGIIPLPANPAAWLADLPHGIRRDLRRRPWRLTTDAAFPQVLQGCANRKETWIDPIIARSYLHLHKLGHAHSLEVWLDDHLTGGLYGVHIGAAFFGESMFHLISGASKVALVALIGGLASSQFQLLDTQWLTPHLALFGAIEIPRAHYLALLGQATNLQLPFPSQAICSFLEPKKPNFPN